jgi:hypothetical protein
MKLVAIARTPPRPQEAAQAVAAATGLTLAETRMRLAPEPPALLARMEDDEADALVATLRGVGLAVLAIDANAPSDRDRTVAHTVALGAAGASFTSRAGEALEVAWPDVLAVLRATRMERAEAMTTEASKKFSAGKALLTGGLAFTKKSEKVVRSAQEQTEQLILLYARDGSAAALVETQLDFSFLGKELGPSRTANMALVAQKLRARAPAAFYDERLLRLGRRPLPFMLSEARTQVAKATVTHTDTAGAVDVLAEILRQAVAQGLLP